MDIWRRGAAVSGELIRLADTLEQRRRFRFAEQLRAAALSITNNIAEGSGSDSDVDFAHFINIARRSVCEVASTLLLLVQEGFIQREVADRTRHELEQQSRMLLVFRRTLRAAE